DPRTVVGRGDRRRRGGRSGLGPDPRGSPAAVRPGAPVPGRHPPGGPGPARRAGTITERSDCRRGGGPPRLGPHARGGARTVRAGTPGRRPCPRGGPGAGRAGTAGRGPCPRGGTRPVGRRLGRARGRLATERAGVRPRRPGAAAVGTDPPGGP